MLVTASILVPGSEIMSKIAMIELRRGSLLNSSCFSARLAFITLFGRISSGELEQEKFEVYQGIHAILFIHRQWEDFPSEFKNAFDCNLPQ